MQPETPISIVPNDRFRQIRRFYVGSVAIAIPVLFVAMLAAIHKVLYPYLSAVLLIGGVGMLIVALLSRSAAHCPRCLNPLLWHSGPIGTGRLSIGTKKRCPKCDLDLEAPWTPPTEAEMAAAGDAGKT